MDHNTKETRATRFLVDYEARCRQSGIYQEPREHNATPWKSELGHDAMLIEQVGANSEALHEDPHLTPSDRQEFADYQLATELERRIEALGDNGQLDGRDGEMMVYKRPEAVGGGYLVFVGGEMRPVEPLPQTPREAADALGPS